MRIGRRPERLPKIGERVRVVLEGEGPGARVDRATSEVIPARYRARIVGEVNGWERNTDTYVTLAGYGRVPLTAVRRARWWHR